MTNVNVVKVYMKKEGTLKLESKVSSPTNVYEVSKKYLGEVDREHLILLVLDNKNAINSISTIAIGSLNTAIIHPREVYKTAILCNGASIIIVHNHPSGDTTPSKEDILITKRLQESGKILGIDLIDHVIIGDNTYTSLKEKGFI